MNNSKVQKGIFVSQETYDKIKKIAEKENRKINMQVALIVDFYLNQKI